MVALRYQLKDENVDLSEQIFNNAGYAFQLKKTELMDTELINTTSEIKQMD